LVGGKRRGRMERKEGDEKREMKERSKAIRFLEHPPPLKGFISAAAWAGGGRWAAAASCDGVVGRPTEEHALCRLAVVIGTLSIILFELVPRRHAEVQRVKS
jgi:hypothetical protein